MFIQINKPDVDGNLEKYYILICRLRNSRLKAKQIAIMELYLALLPTNGVFLVNGPLGDIKGLISFLIPKMRYDLLKDILPGIGYCDKFYILDFDTDMNNQSDLASINDMAWKGRRFGIRILLSQDRATYESQSAHNRVFHITCEDGLTRSVTGYRGDGSITGRRALPVEDCRCLVNLAVPSTAGSMIDPFAGAGGIVCAARYINPEIEITTVDIDPILAPGLRMYGDHHYIGDAAHISLSGRFDAVVTELPFARETAESVRAGLRNICGYLKPVGYVSVMCAPHQVDMLCKCILDMGMHIYCSHLMDRKGTEAAIIAATTDKSMIDGLLPMADRIALVY